MHLIAVNSRCFSTRPLCVVVVVAGIVLCVYIDDIIMCDLFNLFTGHPTLSQLGYFHAHETRMGDDNATRQTSVVNSFWRRNERQSNK